MTTVMFLARLLAALVLMPLMAALVALLTVYSGVMWVFTGDSWCARARYPRWR